MPWATTSPAPIPSGRWSATSSSTSTGSGIVAFFKGEPFLTGIWDKTPVPVVGKLGTPLVFDTGVYLLVLGMTCLVVFTLGEDD